MKYLFPPITIFVIFILCLPVHAQDHSFSLKITPAGKKIVNTAVDNMAYWKRMIKLGYVKADPYQKVPKPVFRSSIIKGDGIPVQDSPDIPVTDLSNTTQSENSIFVSPENEDMILNSNNSTDWNNGTAAVLYGSDDLYSSDAGQTWEGEILGTTGSNSGDPTTAIGLNGWWYVGMINSGWGQSVTYSTDQGTNWTEVVVAPSPGGNNIFDKNHLWIDNKPGSPFEGYLYNAWTNFVTGSANENNIEITRSNDHGVSWSTPANISSAVNAGLNHGVNLQTGPGGEVYAAWAIYDVWPGDENALGFAKSITGGAVFMPASRIIDNIRGIRYTTTSKNMRVNSFPSMTVDVSGGPDNGNIYIVWANHGVPGINSGNDIDIYLIRSADGGSTWSAPVRVNQDPPGLGKQHFLPWITCDPDNGTLSVIYYDDRNTSSTQCETWVSYSFNGGDSWSDIRVSDVAFTPTPINGLAGGYFGDYLGITSKNMKVYPVWTDNRSGKAMSYVSPFNLGPAPNQSYLVYNSSDLVTLGGQPGQNLNFGDSLHLSLGIKNLGDQPASNINVYLSSTSPYIQITDSIGFYGQFAPGEIKVIPEGYTIKISDNIPDGLMVRFNIRSTNGDSSWYSHFFIESHAPSLVINQLTINDSLGGNNNHKLDPGETVTVTVNTSNEGDFACPATWVNLSVNSPYLAIESDSVYLDTLLPGQSKNASYAVSVADDVTNGTETAFSFTAVSGNYTKTKSFQETIGIVVEDWETHTFKKFPWFMGGDIGWSITDINPWEGLYCARSRYIVDQQSSELNLIYGSPVDDSISFYRKTSSESGWDFLNFYIDDVLQGSWSGEMPWKRVAFPVSAGSHLYKWAYSKDVFYSQGEDCAWIDYIEFPPPILPEVFAGPSDTICAGENYQLQGSAANYDSIQWSTTGDGTFTDPQSLLTVYNPGANDIINGSVELKLTAFGTNGSAISNLFLTIAALPTAQISGQKEICMGEKTTLTIDLTGTPPWQVILNPPDTLNFILSPTTYLVNPTSNTTYTITSVTGLHGCEGSASGNAVVIVHPLPTATISALPNDTLCTWQTLNLYSNASGAEYYLWMPGNKTAADISADMATLGGPGSYWFSLIATSSFACSVKDSILIHVKECVGISEKEISFSSEIFPNPNNGLFSLNISSPVGENIDIRLMTGLNVPVFQEKKWVERGKSACVFDFRKLPGGVYFLEIQRREGKVTHKVVIQ